MRSLSCCWQGEAENDVPAQIQELTADFLGSGKEALRLLDKSVLDKAVFEKFVGKEEKDAIPKAMEKFLDDTQKFLAAEASKSLDPSTARKEQEGAIEQLESPRRCPPNRRDSHAPLLSAYEGARRHVARAPYRRRTRAG